jgi:hypothetical protein
LSHALTKLIILNERGRERRPDIKIGQTTIRSLFSLPETRPIWESVPEQLKEVNVRLTRVEHESIDLRRLFDSEHLNPENGKACAGR